MYITCRKLDVTCGDKNWRASKGLLVWTGDFRLARTQGHRRPTKQSFHNTYIHPRRSWKIGDRHPALSGLRLYCSHLKFNSDFAPEKLPGHPKGKAHRRPTINFQGEAVKPRDCIPSHLAGASQHIFPEAEGRHAQQEVTTHQKQCGDLEKRRFSCR